MLFLLRVAGCREYADLVTRFVKEKISCKPAKITVDHSMSEEVIRALTEKYRSENITVLILDSHFDVIGAKE